MGENEGKGLSRREFLTTLGLGGGSALVIAAAIKLGIEIKNSKEITGVGLPVSFKVGERYQEMRKISGMQSNPEYKKKTGIPASESLDLALVAGCHEAWMRYTQKRDVDLNDYIRMLKKAGVSGDHSGVTFSVGGVDRAENDPLNTHEVMVDPLAGIELVAADYIYEDARMGLRIDRVWSEYRKDDRAASMKETDSSLDTREDHIMLGYARTEAGGLQMMFNLPTEDWWGDPVSSKNITDRVVASLVMLRESPPTHQRSVYTPEENARKLEQRSGSFENILISGDVGAVTAQVYKHKTLS